MAAAVAPDVPSADDRNNHGSSFTKGSDNDISNGPVQKRKCTDIVCLILFILHWFAYIAITFAGVQDGNPTKLYKPRDFRGDYCGVIKQWNNGLNLEEQVKLTYTMNVTHSVDLIAKQLVCSSVSEDVLQNFMTVSQMSTYRCACCKSACSSCYGSLPIVNIRSEALLESTISAKMAGLTVSGNDTVTGNLFSPSGANGDQFSNMWSKATTYFNKVCMTKCNDPTSMSRNVAVGASRLYTYSPPPDVSWKAAWDMLQGDQSSAALKSLINNSFTFTALPSSMCPYTPGYCVPFPGVDFTDLANNYCTFKATAAVVGAVGEAAANTFNALGANDAAKDAKASFGSAVGDALNTLDALVVVGLCSLVIGLVFLVALRFFVGKVVWCSLFAVVLVFLMAGAFMWIRSAQCKGASLLSSGKQMSSAAALTAADAGMNAISGDAAPSEAMTGTGHDYRGVQKNTRNGLSCQRWDSNHPHEHNATTPASYNTSGLDENYCRNPTNGPTIWCFTVDPKQRWEVCSPLGVIQPQCMQGYVVESETGRTALQVVGSIIWGFGVLWILLICFLCKRIRLAIAINKCAAMFVYNTPQVLFVPLCQVVIGITWCCVWAFGAAFLLSQVPADYTPTGAFESYAVAYGTATVPGKCTAQAPVGFPWRYQGDLSSTNDPCSGNLGDTSGIVPRCWKCGPPRYVFDVRFALVFFSLLWNNAFLIALGQCILAGAVCVWFFTSRPSKGKCSPIRRSTYISFRYHLGSMAVGAFILAVVQFVKYFTMYLEKQAQAQKNIVMVYILKVLQCCLWCAEKCIKFLNKNAYIQVAILGTNFCKSAKNAFMLITRNFARFGVVATLGSVIHFLGFVFIMAFTVLLGYFILQGLHPDVYPATPVFLYVVMSYLVAKLYMNVFGVAVDTMLQCFLATEEMGGEGDADFVPGPMKTFLKKTERKPAE